MVMTLLPDNMWNSCDSYILPSQYLASCDNDKNPTFTRIRNSPTKLSSIPVMNDQLKIIRTLTKVIWVKVSKYHEVQILLRSDTYVAIGRYNGPIITLYLKKKYLFDYNLCNKVSDIAYLHIKQGVTKMLFNIIATINCENNWLLMDRFIQSLPYLSNITNRNAIMLKNVSQTKKRIQEIIFKLMLSIKSLHW